MNTKYTSISLLLALAASGTNTWGRTLTDGMVRKGFRDNTEEAMKEKSVNFSESVKKIKILEENAERNTIVLNAMVTCCGWNYNTNEFENMPKAHTLVASLLPGKTDAEVQAYVNNLKRGVISQKASDELFEIIKGFMDAEANEALKDKYAGGYQINCTTNDTINKAFYSLGLGYNPTDAAAMKGIVENGEKSDDKVVNILHGNITNAIRLELITSASAYITTSHTRLSKMLAVYLGKSESKLLENSKSSCTVTTIPAVPADTVNFDWKKPLSKKCDALVNFTADLTAAITEMDKGKNDLAPLDNILKGVEFIDALDRAVFPLGTTAAARKIKRNVIYTHLNSSARITTLKQALLGVTTDPGNPANVGDFNDAAQTASQGFNAKLLEALGETTTLGAGDADNNASTVTLGKVSDATLVTPIAHLRAGNAKAVPSAQMIELFGAANDSLGGVAATSRADANGTLINVWKALNAINPSVNSRSNNEEKYSSKFFSKAGKVEIKLGTENYQEINSLNKIQTLFSDTLKSIEKIDSSALESNKASILEVMGTGQYFIEKLEEAAKMGSKQAMLNSHSYDKGSFVEAVNKAKAEREKIMAILNKASQTPAPAANDAQEKAKVLKDKLESLKKNAEIHDTTEEDLQSVLTAKNWTPTENGIVDPNNNNAAVTDQALVAALKEVKADKVAAIKKAADEASALKKAQEKEAEKKINELAKKHKTTIDVLTQVAKDKEWIIENGEILSTDKKIKISDADIKKAIEPAKKSEKKKTTGEKVVKKVEEKVVSEEEVQDAVTTLKDITDLDDFNTALKDIEASTLKEIDIDEAVSGLEEDDQKEAKETLSKMIDEAKAGDNEDQEDDVDNNDGKKGPQKDVDAAVKRIKATKNRKDLQNEIEKIEKDNPTLLASLDEKKLSDYVTFKSMYAKMDFKKAILRARKASGTKEVSEEKDAITDKKGKKVEARKGRKVQARKGKKVQVSKYKKAALNADKKVAARRRGRNNRKSGLANNKRSKSAGRKSNTVA